MGSSVSRLIHGNPAEEPPVDVPDSLNMEVEKAVPVNVPTIEEEVIPASEASRESELRALALASRKIRPAPITTVSNETSASKEEGEISDPEDVPLPPPAPFALAPFSPEQEVGDRILSLLSMGVSVELLSLHPYNFKREDISSALAVLANFARNLGLPVEPAANLPSSFIPPSFPRLPPTSPKMKPKIKPPPSVAPPSKTVTTPLSKKQRKKLNKELRMQSSSQLSVPTPSELPPIVVDPSGISMLPNPSTDLMNMTSSTAEIPMHLPLPISKLSLSSPIPSPVLISSTPVQIPPQSSTAIPALAASSSTTTTRSTSAKTEISARLPTPAEDFLSSVLQSNPPFTYPTSSSSSSSITVTTIPQVKSSVLPSYSTVSETFPMSSGISRNSKRPLAMDFVEIAEPVKKRREEFVIEFSDESDFEFEESVLKPAISSTKAGLDKADLLEKELAILKMKAAIKSAEMKKKAEIKARILSRASADKLPAQGSSHTRTDISTPTSTSNSQPATPLTAKLKSKTKSSFSTPTSGVLPPIPITHTPAPSQNLSLRNPSLAPESDPYSPPPPIAWRPSLQDTEPCTYTLLYSSRDPLTAC